MSDEVSVEPLAESDLDAVSRIEASSFASPWRPEFFASELKSPGRYNRVARQSGRVVGYLFAMYFMDEMHINKIAVTPESRRQGVAGLLMEECLEFARRNSITMISLEVRESNGSAQEFYDKLSFEPIHRRPHYYPDGESAIVMARRVV